MSETETIIERLMGNGSMWAPIMREAATEIGCVRAERDRAHRDCELMGVRITDLERENELLRAELARVRLAHRAIMNEVLYGGTDLDDGPDIDRIHDFAKVGLKDMLAEGGAS